MQDGKRDVPEDVQKRIVNDNTAFSKETGIGFYTNRPLWRRSQILYQQELIDAGVEKMEQGFTKYVQYREKPRSY